MILFTDRKERRDVSVQVAKRWFTVAQYNRMGEAGILTEDDRVELVEGEIIEMSPIGRRHAACVGRLTNLLGRLLTDRAIVWVQNPIVLDDYSEPQPDVALLRRRDDFYEQSLPTPGDVLLIVEVSDTTLEYDRQLKVPLYARAGVAEVWIVNLIEEKVEIYSGPASGAYHSTKQAGRGATINSPGVFNLTLDVDDILGREEKG
jgi:Uma2 family endonuclease